MPDNYLFCQHGLFGTRKDFESLLEFFREYSGSVVNVIVLTGNENITATLHGVEAAGERCYDEILSYIDKREGSESISVSFLGHSMGGLFLRYALRKLFLKNCTFWEERGIHLSRAIFIASPHCGISSSSWIVRTGSHYLVGYLFKSMKDLSLSSPLLEELADANGISCLEAFEKVLFYGNAYGDQLVCATSALAVPTVHIPRRTPDLSCAKINEYVSNDLDKFISISDSDSSAHVRIMRNICSLPNLTRYLVQFPTSFPTVLHPLDNSAHTKIICHGLMDRAKAGLPILEHIATFFPSKY